MSRVLQIGDKAYCEERHKSGGTLGSYDSLSYHTIQVVRACKKVAFWSNGQRTAIDAEKFTYTVPNSRYRDHWLFFKVPQTEEEKEEWEKMIAWHNRYTGTYCRIQNAHQESPA